MNKYWNIYKQIGSSTTIASTNWNTFRTELMIPYNGYLRSSSNGSAPTVQQTSYAYLYTSSPYNSNIGYAVR
ncbi:hypothetical protein J6V86_00110 [bacterium]|nr:hypothetical protein [bacterium]